MTSQYIKPEEIIAAHQKYNVDTTTGAVTYGNLLSVDFGKIKYATANYATAYIPVDFKKVDGTKTPLRLFADGLLLAGNAKEVKEETKNAALAKPSKYVSILVKRLTVEDLKKSRYKDANGLFANIISRINTFCDANDIIIEEFNILAAKLFGNEEMESKGIAFAEDSKNKRHHMRQDVYAVVGDEAKSKEIKALGFKTKQGKVAKKLDSPLYRFRIPVYRETLNSPAYLRMHFNIKPENMKGRYQSNDRVIVKDSQLKKEVMVGGKPITADNAGQFMTCYSGITGSIDFSRIVYASSSGFSLVHDVNEIFVRHHKPQAFESTPQEAVDALNSMHMEEDPVDMPAVDNVAPSKVTNVVANDNIEEDPVDLENNAESTENTAENETTVDNTPVLEPVVAQPQSKTRNSTRRILN
jgi:hypothetical protein